MRRTGFTLVEVVVALLVLQLGVLAALATLVHASQVSRRAETLERATTRVESVLDSLAAGATPDTVDVALDLFRLRWTVDGAGRLRIRVVDHAGRVLVQARSTVPVVSPPPAATPYP